MLKNPGSPDNLRGGIDRRSFLKVGGLAVGAAGAVCLTGIHATHAGLIADPRKAVINIFLAGGPSHLDMWDLKTEAPSEIRGPFNPIATSVPGIQIGECFPRIARLMHKCAVVRSIIGSAGAHDAYQCFSGWDRRELQSLGGRPAVGSVLSEALGPVNASIPTNVTLAANTKHLPWPEPVSSGFLRAAHGAFHPNHQRPGPHSARRELLTGLSQPTRPTNNSKLPQHDLLEPNKLASTLNIGKEPASVRNRYGVTSLLSASTCNDQILVARRLVEAGARCVTVSYGCWDGHANNFDLMRDHGPKLDQAVSALIEDLDERGMLNDVTIAVWGEFGRTPRINSQAGRDHWPQVNCALLAGGGMQLGQAIGATNQLGEHVVERPVHMQEVLATIYHNLGINTMTATVVDPSGRPQYLLDHREPIKELV